MSSTKPMNLDTLAFKIRRGIYSSYRAVCVGTPAPITQEQFRRMSDPKIGDLVAETTTLNLPRVKDIDAVGILEKIAQERVSFADTPGFTWDEDVEGRPHPTERVFYIRTLDGRKHRWTNGNFIAAGEL